eukprot:11615553-Ditylum_brightwellii.AAC.1
MHLPKEGCMMVTEGTGAVYCAGDSVNALKNFAFWATERLVHSAARSNNRSPVRGAMAILDGSNNAVACQTLSIPTITSFVPLYEDTYPSTYAGIAQC